MRLLRQTDLLTPMAIRVAATYRLADLIAAGVSSLPELARVSGLSEVGLTRLMRLLISEGVFAWSDSGALALTDTSVLLREGDGQSGQRAWLDLDGFGGRMDRATFELREAIVRGGPSYAHAHGRDIWGDIDANPTIADSFDVLMGTQAAAILPHIVDAYDWSVIDRVVDVGGGSGGLALSLAARYPAMQVTLVDLPGACRKATRRFANAGLADRCVAQPGSFFDRLPPGASAYVLSLVLHNWEDSDAVGILRRCRDALPLTGRILVIDAIIETDGDIPRELSALDLRMFLLMGGVERTLTDYARLASAAGLALNRVLPLPAWRNRWVIELLAAAD
jgi:2,7-dihydroxy-5-methyl-1-naphthoate 7-O-methyltransferase